MSGVRGYAAAVWIDAVDLDPPWLDLCFFLYVQIQAAFLADENGDLGDPRDTSAFAVRDRYLCSLGAVKDPE